MRPISQSDFAAPEGTVYLDTAAEGIPPPAAQEAVACYLRDKGRGSAGRAAMFEQEHALKEEAARLLGAAPDSIALLSSASEGLNLLANSIAWRPGDEVVTTDLEFPSGVLAFLRLRERGVRLRVVRSHGGAVTAAAICNALGPATRLLVLSQVSYKTGANLDSIRAIASQAHQAGALVCVDATQALGRVPVSIDGADFLVASSYKWMLGLHGLGLTYVSPGLWEKLEPASLGWYSVSDLFGRNRFEAYQAKPGAARLMAGMPNFAPIYALRRSLELLRRAGVNEIHAQSAPVVAAIREGFERLRLAVLTPPGYPSGIVSFEHPDCARIGAALAARNVVVWAGDGRVRASVHLYNSAGDAAALLESLEAVLLQQEAGGPCVKA